MYGRVSDGVTLVWPGNPSLLGAIDETQDLFACWVWSQKRNRTVVAVGRNKNLPRPSLSSSERARS